MSLIQEALRRQQEDGGSESEASPLQPKTPSDQAIPPLAAPPPDEKPSLADLPPAVPASRAPREATLASRRKAAGHPPPLPAAKLNAEKTPPATKKELDAKKPAPALDQKEQGRRPLTTVLAVVVLVLLLVGGAVWGLLFGLQRLFKAPALPAGPDSGQASAVAAAPSPAPAPAASSAPSSTPPPPAQPPVPSAATPTPIASGAPPAAPTGPAPRPEPAAPVTIPSPTIPPRVVNEPVKWPPLRLKGVVGSGALGSAMINGSIVGVGDKIDGVTVLSIEQHGAVLEYKGEKQFLKVGHVAE